MKKTNINKCNKDCCLHCGTDYCKFVDELQQLKVDNESLQSLNDFNVQKIETLEVENEKLKKQIVEDLCYEDKSKKCNKAFYIDEINKQKLEKAEQCLDEIEHILEVNKRELDECLHNDIDCQILQVIKKVKKNEVN